MPEENPGSILILDDEINYARMVRDLLRVRGFKAEMYTSPEVALKALREEDFDLVVSDFKMPLMDGSEFLKEALLINPHLPVIMISGLINMPELVKVANQGVTLVLEKPFDIEVFMGYVGRFVQPAPDGDVDHGITGKTGKHVTTETSESGKSDVEGSKKSGGMMKFYPQQLNFLADDSASSQQFVQTLWDALHSGNLVCIKAEKTAEFGWLLNEIAGWKKTGGQHIIKYTWEDLNQPEAVNVLEALAIGEDEQYIVSVDMPDYLGEAQLVRVLDLLHELIDSLPAAGNIHWVLHLPIDFPNDSQVEERNPLFTDSVQRDIPILTLLSLSQRPADWARYVRRTLQEKASNAGLPQAPALNPEAVLWILEYFSVGNFDDLLKILDLAFESLENDELDVMPLEKAAIKLSLNTPPRRFTSISQRYLEGEQKSYLKFASQQVKENGESVLAAVGVDPEHFPKPIKIEKLALLHPELLRP